MKLNTYLNFAGNCAEALRYYETHLGAKIGMVLTRGELPDQSQVKPEPSGGVAHARISIGDTEVMGSDVDGAQPMRSAYLLLSVESDKEAERIYSALSDGGQVFMPMHETFFASRFAQLRDRFGDGSFDRGDFFRTQGGGVL